MTRIRSCRPSPAMVVALVALSVALAGTASALPGRNRVKRDDIARNAVRSSDIRKNAVRTRHIKKRQVTRSRIAKRSIDSALVADDALTGEDLLESSLSKVGDADKLDGKDSSEFASNTKVNPFTLTNGQQKEIYKVGNLTLTARCTISPAGDSALVLISTTQDNSAFEGDASANPDLDTTDSEGERSFLLTTGGSGAPTFSRVAAGFALAPDGSAINGASLYAGVNVLGLGGQCLFGGQIAG
jgi:hypothetical protein